ARCGERRPPMTSRYAEKEWTPWTGVTSPPVARPIPSSSSRSETAARRCSVLDECLRWAIDSGQDAGVWGGLSEDERRALKRRTVRLRARAAVLSAPCLSARRLSAGRLLVSDR